MKKRKLRKMMLRGEYPLDETTCGFEIWVEVWYDPKAGSAAEVVAMAAENLRARARTNVPQRCHEVQGVWSEAPATEHNQGLAQEGEQIPIWEDTEPPNPEDEP